MTFFFIFRRIYCVVDYSVLNLFFLVTHNLILREFSRIFFLLFKEVFILVMLQNYTRFNLGYQESWPHLTPPLAILLGDVNIIHEQHFIAGQKLSLKMERHTKVKTHILIMLV